MGPIKRYSADELLEMRRRGDAASIAHAIEGPLPEDEHYERLLEDDSVPSTPPADPPPVVAVMLGLDPDTVRAYEAEAPDRWRERMAEVLRAHAETHGR